MSATLYCPYSEKLMEFLVQKVLQSRLFRFLLLLVVYAGLYHLRPSASVDSGLPNLIYLMFIGGAAGSLLPQVFFEPRHKRVQYIPNWFIQDWVDKLDPQVYQRYVDAKASVIKRATNLIPLLIIAVFCFYVSQPIAGGLVCVAVSVLITSPIVTVIREKQNIDRNFKAMLKAWHEREGR